MDRALRPVRPPRRSTKRTDWTAFRLVPDTSSRTSPFTLPGVVHAYISLAERYGTKTIDELLAPAIRYAEEGIPNYEYMLNRLDSAATAQQFDLYGPGGWDVFYNRRQLPEAGSLLVQPGLANTLRAMLPGSGNGHALSREEGLQRARDVFYRGPVAQLIADSVASVGGIMTTDGPGVVQVPVRHAGQDHLPRLRNPRP